MTRVLARRTLRLSGALRSARARSTLASTLAPQAGGTRAQTPAARRHPPQRAGRRTTVVLRLSRGDARVLRRALGRRRRALRADRDRARDRDRRKARTADADATAPAADRPPHRAGSGAVFAHVGLEVSDLARSAAFYDAVFHRLGVPADARVRPGDRLRPRRARASGSSRAAGARHRATGTSR